MGEPKQRPQPFSEKIADLRGVDSRKATRAFEWGCEWLSYWFGNWAFLEVLEYAGKLGILIAAIAYIYPGCAERKQAAEDSKKTKHYVAWQTINSAVGKSGDAGRSDALQDLNKDGVALDGIDLSGGAVFIKPLILTNAHMEGAILERAQFEHPNFSGAKMRDANFSRATIRYGHFQNADLQGVTFESSPIIWACDFSSIGPRPDYTGFAGAKFMNANFSFCSFVAADLGWSDWNGAQFEGCNFANASLRDIQHWRLEGSVAFLNANIYHVEDAPEGFREWATNNGAVEIPITNHYAWLDWLNSHGSVKVEIQK